MSLWIFRKLISNMKKIWMLSAAFFICGMAAAQQSHDIKIEKPEQFGAAPGKYTAEFRLRLPREKGEIKYVVVIVPGFNIDGREYADDREWLAFSDSQQCAILACFFTISGDTGIHYNVVDNWSGKALFDVLSQYAVKTQRKELNEAMLLFWGHSAGSGFGYNMANWKPGRVAAFVAGKSVYNTGDPQAEILKIPGLFISGENDKERFALIAGRYQLGRRSGALWCYAIEPGIGHNIGKSPSLGRAFLKAVMARREAMASGGADTSRLGNLKDYTIQPKGYQATDTQLYTWLPDEIFARDWQWVVSAGRVSGNSTPRLFNR